MTAPIPRILTDRKGTRLAVQEYPDCYRVTVSSGPVSIWVAVPKDQIRFLFNGPDGDPNVWTDKFGEQSHINVDLNPPASALADDLSAYAIKPLETGPAGDVKWFLAGADEVAAYRGRNFGQIGEANG
ncbi:MAG: hypothetical protein ACOVQ0_16490 [Novosphingobium sp.]|uniref:hypothetical protein n=1 Tax=Novosphingobium sp. TaxID=1874826 RepID=UPI003B9BF5E9